jgi:4-amino-4-deoxy-L-arabinose transferase-like glycosyltransferase
LDVLTNTSSRRLAWAAVLALFLAVYLGSAFSPALQDDVDTSHAIAAREMLTRHDFVTLHINGVRYLEKAPVMYWLVAGSYRLLGVTDFATRLPTLAAMFLMVLLGMVWGSRAFGSRAGVYTGLFTATGVGFFLFTRVLIPDAILSLFIAASFYCLVCALDRPNARWTWYAIYALLALAVLTKGLLALVVFGLTLPVYLAITGEWRRWREFHLFSGLLLFLVIAAPWHILASLRNPGFGNHHGFLWFYFVNEHFLRFLGKRIPKDYNKLPGYLYWSLHLVWLFPWSLYLPLALRRLCARGRSGVSRRVPDREAPSQCGSDGPHPPSFGKCGKFTPLDFRSRTRLICILWASVTLVFFALSTNQEYYTLPAYLAFFLLLADSLAAEQLDGEGNTPDSATGTGQQIAPTPLRPWLLATSAVSVTVRLAFAAVLIAGLWSSRHLPFVPDIGAVLAQTNLNTDTLSMGHILNLTGQSFAALRLPAILAVIALVFGSLAELILCLRRRYQAATWALAVTMMVFLIAAHVALLRFDPFLSSHVLAMRIQQQVQPQDRVLIYGDESFGSSLVFYLHHPVELVNGRSSSLWFGSTFPDAPHIFLDDSDLRQLWASPTRVYLFVPQQDLSKVETLLPAPRVFTESSGKVIYINH